MGREKVILKDIAVILYLCTGAAVGDMFCNQESHRITNTTFWTFTVGIHKYNIRRHSKMLQTSLPAMIIRCITKKAKTRVAIVNNKNLIIILSNFS